MSEVRVRRLQPVVAPARSGFPVRGPVLVVIVGLLLSAAVIVLAGAGSSAPAGSPQALPPVAPVVAEGEDAVEESGEDAVAVPLPLVTYELFLARDPFEPVVPEPEPAPTDPPAPADPADPTDPSAPPAPTDPTDPSAPANGNANGPCTGTVEVVCNGRVLTVVEVFEENGELVAILQVDTMRYEVRPGDTVAEVFEVVSISPDVVRLLFGDRVVRVQVGDNALK